MNILLLTPEDSISNGRYRICGSRHKHLVSVLKLSDGAELSIGVLNGGRGRGRIVAIDRSEAIIEPLSLNSASAPTIVVDLICAIPRPKILRKVLFVAGMFGVREVHFVRANRTDKSYLQSPLLSENGSRPYLMEGLSQGEWTRMPDIKVHPLFRPFVEDILPDLPDWNQSIKVLADLGADVRLTDLVPRAPNTRFCLAIGPEGGWVDFERELLVFGGFRRFLLGPANLRVEYAIAAALGQIELAVAGDR